VVVHQDDKSRGGEHLGESLQAVFLHTGEAVGHRDGRMGTGAVGDKQPAPQNYVVFGGELDVLFLNHFRSFQRSVKLHNIDDARTASELGTPH
jgi:hypothetical protein